MRPSRLLMLIAIGAISATTLLLGEALACSMGPPSPPTADDLIDMPKHIAAGAGQHLRDSDIVAEVVVTSLVRPSERGKWCKQFLALECTAETKDPRCDGTVDPVDRFFELCNLDAAIHVEYGEVWKGAPDDLPELVYIQHGNYPNLELDSHGSCDFRAVVAVGDRFLFCGSIDSGGAVQGGDCAYDDLFRRVKDERARLSVIAYSNPDNLENLATLARFQERWREDKAATASYASLREHGPYRITALLGLARLAFNRHRYPETEALLKEVLSLEPENAAAERLLGRTRYLMDPNIDIQAVDMRGFTLLDRDFSGTDLRGKDFSWGTLQNLTFHRGRLESANFSNAELINVSFADSQLDGADFSDVRGFNVDFRDASLRGADFRRHTDYVPNQLELALRVFQRADLTDAHLGGNRIDIYPDPGTFPTARNLGHADLNGVILQCGHSYNLEKSSDANSRRESWRNFLEALRIVHDLTATQPNVQMTDECTTAVDHYLHLPKNCQPWGPAGKRTPGCQFLKE